MSDNIYLELTEEFNQGRTRAIDAETLVRVKQTQREKDYAVIGELARRLPPGRQLLYGRSARDLIDLASRNPDRVSALMPERPLLEHAVRHGRPCRPNSWDER